MRDLVSEFGYLNGTSFCMVFMTVLDQATEKVQLSPIYGMAKVFTDRLIVEDSSGTEHAIPTSALSSILPNDGTKLLKDSTHYVIVKIATL